MYSYNSDNELTLEETDNYNSGVTDPVTTASSLQYKNVYSYDANGSTTAVTTTDSSGTSTTTYTYDLRNRMKTVTSNGTTTTYTYDDAGDIVGQTTGSNVTSYLRDDHNPTGYSQILETWTGGTTPAVTYTIGTTVFAQNAGGAISFLMPDGEGSRRQLTAYTSSTSTNGKVTARYDYDAFGDLITFTASTHAANTASTVILYKNEPLDTVTGNYVMEVREEEPATGRFITRDTIRLSPYDLSNADLYLFVRSDVTNLSDFSGRMAPVLGLADPLFSTALGESFDVADAALAPTSLSYAESVVAGVEEASAAEAEMAEWISASASYQATQLINLMISMATVQALNYFASTNNSNSGGNTNNNNNSNEHSDDNAEDPSDDESDFVDPVNDTFDNPEDAVGPSGVDGVELVDSEPTKNPRLIAQGYTEVEYYVDRDGVQWTVPYNPTTEQWMGGHPSSSNE